MNLMKTTKDKNETDLLDVKSKIQSLNDKLQLLHKLKKEILNRIDSEKRKAKVEKQKGEYLMMMMLASKGMTLREVSIKLQIPLTYMTQRINRTWRSEFPDHYDANWDNIKKTGVLNALRNSPPIFAKTTKPKQ